LAEESSGCVVYGEGGAVALIGVQDLVVVHAGGATLVCPKDRAQDVRRIVERLEEEGPELL
jgi:mannose-1-phosphate guanylyltransferase